MAGEIPPFFLIGLLQVFKLSFRKNTDEVICKGAIQNQKLYINTLKARQGESVYASKKTQKVDF